MLQNTALQPALLFDWSCYRAPTCEHSLCTAPLRLLWGALLASVKLLCCRSAAQQPFWAGGSGTGVIMLMPCVVHDVLVSVLSLGKSSLCDL